MPHRSVRIIRHEVARAMEHGLTVSEISRNLGVSYNRVADAADFIARNMILGAGNEEGASYFGTPVARTATHQNNPFNSLPNPFFSGATMTNDHMNIDNEGAAPVQMHGHAGGHYHGPKKKIVHVSKQLAKKIKHIQDDVDCTKGHYVRHEIGDFLSLPSASKQFVVDDFGIVANGALSGASSTFNQLAYNFSPEYFLHVASVLFNIKPDRQLATVADYALDSATSFRDLFGLKFDVITSKVTYTLHNVSGRAIHIKMYNCTPKKVGAYKIDYTLTNAPSPNSGDIDGNVRTAATTSGQEAKVTWGTTPIGTATTSIGVMMVPPSIAWERAIDSAVQTGEYLGSSTCNDIGQAPFHPEFTSLFSTELTEIVLEPTQTFEYVVHGPKNFTWEFNKHIQNRVFLNVQKYMSCPMIVFHGDVVRGTAPTGVGVSTSGSGVPQITVSRTHHTTISMPDQVGFRFPTTTLLSDLSNAVQPLNMRRKRNQFVTYNTSAPVNITGPTLTYGPAGP